MKNVFVSSTFRDFQYERDYLNQYVLPQLNGEARKYGENVNFCDLRWGINTEEEQESSKKIISVCLDEIDRTKPYMIILLGDRYGYIPSKQQIEHIVEERNLQLEDLEVSITQLEIEYGFFAKTINRPHIYIYLRKIIGEDIPAEYCAETELHKQKLRHLVERLENMADAQIRTYEVVYKENQMQGIETFGELVKQDLLLDFSKEWHEYEALSYYEKENRIQWNVICEQYQKFLVNKEKAQKIKEELLNHRFDFMAIKGVSGCGKSVLCSYLCEELNKCDYVVIPIMAGETGITKEPVRLMEYLIWHLEEVCGLSHKSFRKAEQLDFNVKAIKYEKKQYMEELCQKIATTGKKVLIVVDGVDQIFTHGWNEQLNFFPSALGGSVQVLVTAIGEFQLPHYFEAVMLPELTKDGLDEAICGIEKQYGKELAASVKGVLRKKKQAHNLLYLKLAMLRLIQMNREDFQIISKRGDGEEQINQRQIEILSKIPRDTEELAIELLKICSKDISGEWLYETLKWIAVSRNGLRMQDLQKLVSAQGNPFIPLDFYVLIHRLKELFFIRENGNIDFIHKNIRNAILKMVEEKEKYHRRIFFYLKGLPDNDELKNNEIIYHSYYAGKGNYICEFVVKLRTSGYIQRSMNAGILKRDQAPEGFLWDVDYDVLCDQAAFDIHSLVATVKIEKIVSALFPVSKITEENTNLYLMWLEFVNYYMPWVFGYSEDELANKYSFFTVAVYFARNLLLRDKSISVKKNVANVYGHLATVEYYNRAFWDDSLKHFERKMELYEEIFESKEEYDKKDRKEYAKCLDAMMVLLYQKADYDSLKRVIELGEALNKMYDEMELPEYKLRVIFNMGLAYEAIGGADNIERAYQSYMKVLVDSEKYAEEKKDIQSYLYGIISELKAADMCHQVQNLDLAFQLYVNAFYHSQELDDKLHSQLSKKYVIDALEGLGIISREKGTEESLKQAEDFLQTAFDEAHRLYEAYGTTELKALCTRIYKVWKE